MAGYSGTPLVRKLGIRAGERVSTINAPEHYATLVGDLPEGASYAARVSDGAPFVHLFVTSARCWRSS